jgi:hypothetical protein
VAGRTRPLPASQTLAVLAALCVEPADALCLVLDEDGPGLAALPPGHARQVAALLGWYSASVRLKGLEWVFGTTSTEFQTLVRLARHERAPLVVRAALAGPVDREAVCDLAWRMARECDALREEGARIVAGLLGDHAAKARATVAARASQREAAATAVAAWLDGDGA